MVHPPVISRTTSKTVVWFKRDLRIRDHAPLAAAALDGSVLPMYLHEPAMTTAPDFAPQHAAFIDECLQSLHAELAARGGALLRLTGAAVAVLESIWRATAFGVLRSHEETGNWLSYQRDKAVAEWCRQRGVSWIQTPQNGVIRGSADYRASQNWSAQMEDYTSSEPVKVPAQIVLIDDIENIAMAQLTSATEPLDGADAINILNSAGAPDAANTANEFDTKPGRLKGGRAEAIRLLGNFFKSRILAYPGAVSSPLTAEHGCSRLSPYLAFGVVSVREVIMTMNRRLALPDVSDDGFERQRMIKAMRFFVDRIQWRSGYFQNMEAMPSLEFVNINRKMDGLRETTFNTDYFDAWKRGETGYPMIDACMKMLVHTGWINMRMRGMLISFAVNELWLHWREPGLFLARQFLDYEPAIHYNQLQIHAGTAGNTQLLAYNPVKQAQDLDPTGKFVRRWIPALQRVPNEFIVEPWKMSSALQDSIGIAIGIEYPAPIVDHVSAGRLARERVSAAQKGKLVIAAQALPQNSLF